MKKLMIAFGLVAIAAVSAQAAKVKWSVSGVTPYGSDTDTTGYYMACFCQSVNWTDNQDNKTSIADATAWAASKGATTTGVHVLGTAELDDAGSGATASAFATMQNIWKNSNASGAKAGDFFAVIFNSDDISTATAYMVTTVSNIKFSTTAATTQTASVGAGTWTAVPEPTSGLLLLLGMAGLALKRKRA